MHSLPGSRWFRKINRRWLVAIPVLIVALVYLPALRNGLVWDDVTFLSDLPLYRDPTLWIEALRQPFVISSNYFRPLALLTFVGESRLGGLNPTLFHLTNILLHACNAGLVAILARHLWAAEGDDAAGDWLAVGVGLLYGLHPALLEGVAFISSRFDLLLTTFLLLALVADVTLRRQGVARALAVGLAFLLAALSKEMAVAFAVVLPLWHLARRERPLWPLSRFWQPGDLISYTAVLVAGGVYLCVRYFSLGYLLLPLSGVPTGSPLQHLLLVARSLAEYGLLIIWPFSTLTPIHYSTLPIPTTDPLAWASLIVALVALAAGLVMLVREAPRSGWLAVAGALSLLPVSNVLPLNLFGGAFVAERFLLFPMTLFALAAAPLLRPLIAWRSRPSSVGGVLRQLLPPLWLAASVLIIETVLPFWQSDLTLWTWGARRAPLSSMPFTNLARMYSERGDLEAGLEAAQRATELDPTNGMAWNNTGQALFHLGRYAEAQAAFEQAAALEPGNALFWNNLAAVFLEQGQLREAERVLLDESLQRDPNQPLAHLNLGAVYLQADRPDLAVPHLQEALRLLPPGQTAKAEHMLAQTEEPARWLRLADLLLGQGDAEGALRAFERAGDLGASSADAAVGQSAALIELQAWSRAEAVLREALVQAPDDARLYNNLGVVVREQGDLEAAQEYFERAATLSPEWDLPRQNIETLKNH
jgi:tetratricopeptide (TPR) repeat protein